jgi:hypothetical protein
MPLTQLEIAQYITKISLSWGNPIVHFGDDNTIGLAWSTKDFYGDIEITNTLNVYFAMSKDRVHINFITVNGVENLSDLDDALKKFSNIFK